MEYDEGKRKTASATASVWSLRKNNFFMFYFSSKLIDQVNRNNWKWLIMGFYNGPAWGDRHAISTTVLNKPLNDKTESW